MTNIQTRLPKMAILLVISLSLLWFAEEFSPVTIFAPQSTGWQVWMSYAKDLLLPFGFYFFLCLFERWLPDWRRRALAAFALPAAIELVQAVKLGSHIFPHYYLGVFDPLDIVMYATGVTLAVIIEQLVLARSLRFWQP